MHRQDGQPSVAYFTILLLIWITLHGCANRPEVVFQDGHTYHQLPSSMPPRATLGPTHPYPVRPTSFETIRPLPEPPLLVAKNTEALLPQVPDKPAVPIPRPSVDAPEHPISLSNALDMGGANHLQIQLAREKVVEAHADLLAAETLWLPSLRAGIGWNKHDGRLQETEGNILEVNRNSFYLGAGAGLGQAPLAGAASGPMRLMMNLSLADAVFEKVVASNLKESASAAKAAIFNDSLLSIAVAYIDLLESHSLRTNAHRGLEQARHMLDTATTFSEAGAGSQAEVDRARAEVGHWQLQVLEAKRLFRTRSAELARLIRWDSPELLIPVETELVPLEIVDPHLSLEQLQSHALANRPELTRSRKQVQAASERVSQEHWRPWLPHVQLGFSGGTMGGGPSSQFDNQGSRSDVDLAAIWEVEQLGYGNLARQYRATSQQRQARYQVDWTHDQIVAETTIAVTNVASYQQQYKIAQANLAAAAASYDRNRDRVREAEGLPVELHQSIRATGAAMNAYTQAISHYNRAQFHLLRSIGVVPSDSVSEGAGQAD